MQANASSYPVVRGFYGDQGSTGAPITDSGRAEAQRQLACAKASLDSTLSAVLLTHPELVDGAYVQSVAAMLMKAHRSAREAASQAA